MERNEFALAGALLLILCATFLMALALAGAKLSDMASWAQAIGTVGAIGAAIAMPIWERRRLLHHDQSIAAMKVAARLRAWLAPCASAVQNMQNFESSDGAFGNGDLTIPAMEFNMDTIASMPLARAKVIYSILEQHARAISYINGSTDFLDWDERRDEFYRESAKLFGRVRKLYVLLATDTGLHPYTCQQWELDAINKAATEAGVKEWKHL